MNNDRHGKVLFFNPRSAPSKPRFPLSVLSLARMFPPEETSIVDGNLHGDPLPVLFEKLADTSIRFFAVTVMPGPQIAVAIKTTKAVRERYPHLHITWGGYFSSFHPEVILESDLVDSVICGRGEETYLELVQTIRRKGDPGNVSGLFLKRDNTVVRTESRQYKTLESLPPYNWSHIEVERYPAATFLGEKTISYHSSYGCPHRCSFCAVNTLSSHQWDAESPTRIERTIGHFFSTGRADSLEFHDNNFFVSEKRTAAFAEIFKTFNIRWWAEGRIDTLLKYHHETWDLMRESGLKMIFTGAESGSQENLEKLGKAGLTSADVLEFARRCRHYGIVPEFSFMLGSASDVWSEFKETRELIANIKKVNRDSVIVLYLYSPVALTPQMLRVHKRGFSFPEKLEEWNSPPWNQFDLRRGAHAPWLPKGFVRAFHNYETVINGKFPVITDHKLPQWTRWFLPILTSWRFKTGFYRFPVEIKLLQAISRYSRPETQGL